MNSYHEKRQILSDALCPHLAASVDAVSSHYDVGGCLLGPGAAPITRADYPSKMAQVMSVRFTTPSGAERFLAIVFQPVGAGGVSFGIVTASESPKHIVEIFDDPTPHIPQLKAMIAAAIADADHPR